MDPLGARASRALRAARSGRDARAPRIRRQNMEGYDAATYGQRCADVYDDWYDGYDEAALSLLADLANGGRALELGIGTGRIALPLAARGIEVHGIDASEAMIARLRAKP